MPGDYLSEIVIVFFQLYTFGTASFCRLWAGRFSRHVNRFLHLDGTPIVLVREGLPHISLKTPVIVKLFRELLVGMVLAKLQGARTNANPKFYVPPLSRHSSSDQMLKAYPYSFWEFDYSLLPFTALRFAPVEL